MRRRVRGLSIREGLTSSAWGACESPEEESIFLRGNGGLIAISILSREGKRDEWATPSKGKLPSNISGGIDQISPSKAQNLFAEKGKVRALARRRTLSRGTGSPNHQKRPRESLITNSKGAWEYLYLPNLNVLPDDQTKDGD